MATPQGLLADRRVGHEFVNVRDHHGDYVGMVSSTDIHELMADTTVSQ